MQPPFDMKPRQRGGKPYATLEPAQAVNSETLDEHGCGERLHTTN